MLKGASGLQAGVSSPAGLINLLTKRPDANRLEVQLGWEQEGSWTAALDWAQRGSTFGWRLNASSSRLDPWLQGARGERQGLALAGDWRFGSDTLVEAEFEAIWKQIEADIKADRLDAEDKGKSEDQLKTEYRDIAKRRVKLGLLLSEVGRTNNIQVPNDDLTRAVIAEARRFPGQEKQVIDYYQKSPEALNQLRAPIYEDKVIDFIAELANVTEKPVTAEELYADPDDAGHHHHDHDHDHDHDHGHDHHHHDHD